MGDIDLEIIFTEIQFQNVHFTSRGNLFDFRHQLPNPVQVKNSIFENVYGANIESRGSFINSELKNLVEIKNSTFRYIKTPLVPLIVPILGSEMSIQG